jgi:solute carrier family 35 (UDP-sugar transporter), member A1/2/3
MMTNSGSSKGFTALQLVILVCLCLQTSGYCVLLSVSKTILQESYSNTEVLVLSELIKLIVSGALVLQSGDDSGSNTRAICRLANLLLRGKKLIVLVVLYSIANIIPFFAIHYIGAPTFTVIMQMKVFTTAGFSTVMLSRQYSSAKWRALVLLVIGVILVSSPIINRSPAPQVPLAPGGVATEGEANEEGGSSYGTEVLGLCLTLIQATISGFTSVYFEGMLKDDNSSIWERNFQLAFYSVICMVLINISEGSAAMLFQSLGWGGNDEEITAPAGFLRGWTVLAVVLALLQGAGGLLVAATLKYADAVLKCFATAVSIILTSVIGYFFLDNKIDMFVAIGFVTTVLSIFNYTLDHQQVKADVAVARGQDVAETDQNK